jgi:hypothetical protein
MIPVWSAWLPLMSAFVGLGLAYSYTWPMPWCAETGQKTIYLFLQCRWMFDYFWNQQVAAPVLKLGSYTWASLDKGFLEVLGPRGLTNAVSNWAVPSMKQWQSGAVQDYALIYQVVVIMGVLALAYPTTGLFNVDLGLDNLLSENTWLTDFKVYALALFLLVIAPSISSFSFFSTKN